MSRPPSASSVASSRPPTRFPSVVNPSRSNSRSSRRSRRQQDEAPPPPPLTTTTTSEPPSSTRFYGSLFVALIFSCIPLLGAPSVCFYSRHLLNRHGGVAKEVIGGKGLVFGAVIFIAWMIILALVQLPNKAGDGSFLWVGAIGGESAPVALISMWILGTFVAWSVVFEGMLSTPSPPRPRSIPLRNIRPRSTATPPPLYDQEESPPEYPQSQRRPSTTSLPPAYDGELQNSQNNDPTSSEEELYSSGEESDRRASRRLWGRSASTSSHRNRRRPASVFSVPGRNSLPADRQSI
ncbi:hypothetical protein JCM3765_000064 [Sporobolomyces pararoseus]